MEMLVTLSNQIHSAAMGLLLLYVYNSFKQAVRFKCQLTIIAYLFHDFSLVLLLFALYHSAEARLTDYAMIIKPPFNLNAVG